MLPCSISRKSNIDSPQIVQRLQGLSPKVGKAVMFPVQGLEGIGLDLFTSAQSMVPECP